MIWILVLVILGFTAWLWYRTCQDDEWGMGATLITIFVTLPAILIPTCWAFSNGEGLARWQTFYEVNTSNYQVTIDHTASYLSGDKYTGVIIQGSVEKFNQAAIVSERLKEWRDAVNRYNSTIASMKYYNRNIFTGVLVPDEIEDMKILMIK